MSDNLVVPICTAVINQSWTYEPGSSRLQSVSQGTASATYSYLANSSLIDNITNSSGGVNRLTSTRVYDNLNRLRSITNLSTAAANAVAKSFTYTYNAANQRTRVDREDTTNWNYGYDGLGHVTSAIKKQVNDTPLAGHQFGYTFDALGNRKTATFGGNATGTAGFHTISYTANEAGDRNQYSGITTPGVVLSTGKANATASVTINGQPAQDRQGDHFAHQNAVPNETAAQLFDLTVVATDGTNTNTVNRKELVPIQTAAQTSDADGNLTFDGYRDYTWDAENRLLSVQTRAALVPAGGSETRVDYAYDYLSRRILRHAQQKLGNAWYTVSQTKYLYDGWNVIAELGGNPATPEVVQSYLWGLDLSGTAQGAGGVGGLLAIQKHTGANAGVHFVAFDGNGNVAALASAADGILSASYEYDAFGNLLEMSGAFAAANPYRFSTKPWDEGSGLYYYGFRFYDPVAGRWLSRDPIGEAGGVNLYSLLGNQPISLIDILGLEPGEFKVYFLVNPKLKWAYVGSVFEVNKTALDRIDEKLHNTSDIPPGGKDSWKYHSSTRVMTREVKVSEGYLDEMRKVWPGESDQTINNRIARYAEQLEFNDRNRDFPGFDFRNRSQPLTNRDHIKKIEEAIQKKCISIERGPGQGFRRTGIIKKWSSTPTANKFFALNAKSKGQLIGVIPIILMFANHDAFANASVDAYNELQQAYTVEEGPALFVAAFAFAESTGGVALPGGEQAANAFAGAVVLFQGK